MVQLDARVLDPFEIVVGTYEQYLLGYKVENIVNEYKVEKSFATHSHLGSVRTVAGSKHYLASGGADDTICLYDMQHRIESGKLMHHNDTVNCVEFTPQASHLFSCSNDGSIAAIRCGNWQIEKHWQKAHKGLPVNTIAIHPTGKIALSTGADGILRTWNLVKGRQAYATNLVPRLKLDAKNVTVLKWSPNGEKYLLAVNQRIDVYSLELAGVDNEIKFDSKIMCVEFLKDDFIAVGLESGKIKFYDLEQSVQTVEAIAHDIRVKCMAFKDDMLVTASSSGEIKLWRYTSDTLDILQTVNCSVRVTCLSLIMSTKTQSRRSNIKVEEVKQKKNCGFRQEVVVVDEGSWKVTPINPWQTKSKTKTKELKKKRDWVVESVNTNDDVPPQKKKHLQMETETNEMLHKKRKKDSASTLETNDMPAKKVKKSLAKGTHMTSMVEKDKIYLSTISGTNKEQGSLLQKKRKEIVREASEDLKKEKKKHCRRTLKST